MAVERRIKTIERADGKAFLFIIARDDGCYRFEGKAEQDNEDGHGSFWEPCYASGLYATAQDAEKAAQTEVLWLRDEVRRQEL